MMLHPNWALSRLGPLSDDNDNLTQIALSQFKNMAQLLYGGVHIEPNTDRKLLQSTINAHGFALPSPHNANDQTLVLS